MSDNPAAKPQKESETTQPENLPEKDLDKVVGGVIKAGGDPIDYLTLELQPGTPASTEKQK